MAPPHGKVKQMSNSEKMTMEERLAQRLKESELGMLIDEDGLTDLIKAAIQKAFFEPQGAGYDRDRKPALLVQMAEAQFREDMKKHVSKVLAVVLASDEARNLIVQYAITALPRLLAESVMSSGYSVVTNANQQTEQKLRAVMSNLLIVPPPLSQ